MKKVFILLVLIIALVSILAACSSSPTPAPTSASAQTTTAAKPAASAPATLTPKYGGVLKIVVTNPSNYFGYPGDMASSGGAEVSMPGLEQLVHLDARGQFEPTGLVTAFQVAPDSKSVTFSLRKGVKFHDGTDFNARAVKWCLEQGMRVRLAGTELFTSVEAVDDYNVRINVEHFDARVFQAVADAKISSPAAFDKYGKDQISTHPVGTGPFKFVSFTPDVGVTWERYDGYWGGKPYLDGIISFFIADTMARATALQAGDVDLLFNIGTETAVALRSKGYTVAAGNMNLILGLFPDSLNADSPLSKLSVRQAIDYAMDREELIKLGSGFWQAAYQPSESTSPGYIPNFEGRRYNVSKSRELLAQAGYPNGFDISIIIANNQPQLQDKMVSIQQMLSMASIKVDVQAVTSNVRSNYSRNGWRSGFNVQNVYCGPSQYLSALNYCLGGPLFVSCARPPDWEEAMKEAFYADPAGLDAACRQLNTLLYENVTLTPVYVAPTVIYAVPDYVHDAHLYESGNLYRWTPEKAWLSK